MAANIKHETRALLVRKGHHVDEVLVWENAACKQLDFQDLLPKLLPRPPWDSSPEKARMESEVLVLERLAVPPVVHFSRGSELLVTSIHAASIQGANLQRGTWTRPNEFLAQAEEQWQSVILALICQLRFAMASGYLSLPAINQSSASRSTASRTTSASPVALLRSAASSPTKPAHDRTSDSVEPRSSYFGGIVTCSGYPEQGSPVEEVGTEESGEAAQETLEGSQAAPEIQHPVKWYPGQVAAIREGGSDVQAVLDSEGVKLAIVSWHAPWIEACLELVPFLERLAARFPSVAVMQLDVESSMANKLLAYEKVLTRAESRRRGAKPVIREGRNFPCLTMHHAFNLIPEETFCGSDSLDDLAKLLAARSSELTQQPQALSPLAPGQTQAAPADAPASTSRPRPALLPQRPAAAVGSEESQQARDADKPGLSQPEAETILLDVIRAAAVPSTPSDVAGKLPDNFHVLQHGALEFKRILNQAKQAAQLVVVLWKNGGPTQLHLARTAKNRAETIFVEAPVLPGTDSSILADRLGVKAFPCLQGYFKMKLVKTYDSRNWPTEVEAAKMPTSDHVATTTISRPESGASAAGKSSLEACSGTPLGASSPAESLANNSRAGTLRGGRDTTFDPPQAGIKPGAKKRLPRGLGIYWPRMPCLQCGCPWWLGEDWDARCEWTAEKEGYDDDSQPLPAFKDKYAAFVALLREGRTAEYTE